MRIMKLLDIRHDWLSKGSHKNPVLIMKRLRCENFSILISLTVCEILEMHLMDVITTYLYGLLDNDIYMKISE